MTPVLIHGWGFDAAFWQPFQQAFGREAIVLDLGFRGRPHLPRLPEDSVAITHSLGTLWALTCGQGWRGIVAFNGFGRFTKSDGFPEGVAPRLLDRMLAKLDEAPEAVTADFLARCGASGEALSGLDKARLKEGLEWLRDRDGRPALARQPVRALCGEADPIFPLAASMAALPGVRLDRKAEAGHLLPLTHAQDCAALVLEALADWQ